MKKYFYSLLAVTTMLLAASCSQDEFENGAEGNEVNVTFTAALNKAAQATTRAISDGQSADKLYVLVYDENDVNIEKLNVEDEAAFNDELKATVTMRLVKGQTYKFLFWAQDPTCTAYNLDKTNGTVTVNYDGNANDEARDAFYAAETLTVTGTTELKVTLDRPFAQINIATLPADKDAAEMAGIDFAAIKSTIAVKALPNVLNLFNGTVTGTADADFTATVVPSTDDMLELKKNTDINGEAITEMKYYYVAMNYVLADAKNAVNYTINATITPEGGNDIELEIPNVPVQGDYRTNILGNILTEEATFNIVIDPFYDDEYNYVTDRELAYVLANGGTYNLTADKTIEEQLVVAEGKSVVLNLNDNKLAINNSTLDYGVVNKGSLTVNNGTIEFTGKGTYGAAIANKAQLKLQDVDVTSNGAAAILVFGEQTYPLADKNVVAADAKVTTEINGGTFKSTWSGATASHSAHRYTVHAEYYSHLIMNDCTVEGTGGVNVDVAFATLNNVTANATCTYGAHDLYVAAGNATVTGCTFANAYAYSDNTYGNAVVNGIEYTTSQPINWAANFLAALKDANITTVTLNDDITLNERIDIAVAKTIDLGNKTLTIASESIDYGLVNSSSLTIKDGNIVFTGKGTYGAAICNNHGQLELQNVNVTANGSAAVITKGEVVNSLEGLTAAVATVTTVINGGTFTSSWDGVTTSHSGHRYTVYSEYYSNLTMTDCTVEGTGGVSVDVAFATLNKVTAKATCTYGAHDLYVAAGNATVTDCTFANAAAYSDDTYGKAVVNGIEYANGTTAINWNKVNFLSALNDANVSTVTLEGDVTLNERITLTADKNIDLGGNILTISNTALAYALVNKANTTITNGTIDFTGDGSNGAAVCNMGQLEMKDVNVISNTVCFRNYGETVTNLSGKTAADATVTAVIDGSTFTSSYCNTEAHEYHRYAVHAYMYSNLTMSNSTVKGSGGVSVDVAFATLNKVTATSTCSSTHDLYVACGNATVTDCTFANAVAYSDNEYGKAVVNGTEYANTTVIKF